jgi:NAD+ kinase
MADPLRRIAVLTHGPDDEARRGDLPATGGLPAVTAVAAEAVRELGAASGRLGVELLMTTTEAQRHPGVHELGYALIGDDEVTTAADVCLVFGGDGTILRALGRFVGSGLPTLGVNFGHVGFLASLPREGWLDGLAAIVAGDHRVVDLLTVDVWLDGERHTGVNDVILSRVALRHVLHLEYAVSDVTIGRMLCDGLIVASPAGSTAYNLSCDGPIVEWDASVLVLNFIAPHSLGFRPVVLRPDHRIDVRNVSPVEECEIVVDGRPVGRLCCGDGVRIAAGDRQARLMVRAKGSFYQNVEEKLFDRAGTR